MIPHTPETILVIDDDPRLLRVLVQLLRRDGYTVATAGNGRHALAQLQAQRYEVILSDLSMPEMDGRAFYARLRQQDPWLAQRVIFLTGAFGEATNGIFLEECGQPWLAKPYAITAVRRAIQQVWGGARSAPQPGQAGGAATARSQQLSWKSQALRQHSHALAGQAQTLYARSAHVRWKAAILTGKVQVYFRKVAA